MSNKVVKGFNTVFGELRQGRTHDEMSNKMNELVKAVMDTHKKGSITLTLTVQPATKGAGNAVLVTDEIKLKLPEFERGADVFFATPDNNLQKQDPNQRTLNLEGVESSSHKGELESVTPATRTFN